MIVGSSTCHLAQSREGVFGSGAAGCYPDATVEGLYTLEAGQTATGSILDWYRRHFAGSQQPEPNSAGVHVFQVLDEQAAAVPPGSEGLVVRDDWQGNRSPYKNPQARGAIAGLSLAHGPGHVFRAIYEATACGTRHILEDAQPMASRSSGSFWAAAAPSRPSGSRSTPTSSRSQSPGPRKRGLCPGSAMAAAVAAGAYRDFDEAASAMVAIETRGAKPRECRGLRRTFRATTSISTGGSTRSRKRRSPGVRTRCSR